SSIDIPVLIYSLAKGRNRHYYTKQVYERFAERLTYRQIRTGKRLMLSLVKFNIPVLLTHGNTETRETREWLRLFCYRYPNFHWISDRSIMIDDTQFIGHGWVAVRDSYDRYRSPGEISQRESKSILLNTIGNSRRGVYRNILISHSPPFLTPLDYLSHKKIHAGSLPVREILDSGIVEGVICGHLHEAKGVHRSRNWWGINAGSVIEDEACTVDLETMQVIWYKKVVNRFGISPLIYSNRNQYEYDKSG
ncbi:MAG: metallophosphoesterase family protein, partial [Candidatus Kariarchaeaceae archaeon]